MRTAIVAISMLSLLMPSRAGGKDYFPLAEGVVNEYEYRLSQGSGTYINYFSSTADVDGATTSVLHFAGGVDNGLLHFWSETPEGDKLFHGSDRGFGRDHFSPPLLMIDAPLHVGKTWVVDSRDYPDSIAVRVHFEVTAFGEVTVPAGTLQAFTVEDTWEFPEGMPAGKTHISIWGVPSGTDAAPYVFRRAYADSIGLVHWTFGSRTDRLLSFRPVAVQPSTWSRIRMLYR